MVYLSYAHILEPFSTTEFEKNLVLLPSKMREKVVQFRRWEDSHNSLMGKILLMNTAERFFNMPDILTQLTYSDFKKPHINSSISFNISHAGNLVVCAMSDKHQLGIDVEQLSKIDFALFQDCMSEKEWEQIKLAKDPNREFLKFWTQKEAVIKADGRGLTIPLNGLKLNDCQISIDKKSWHLLKINVHSNYICHLATDKLLTIEDVKMVYHRNFIINEKNHKQ